MMNNDNDYNEAMAAKFRSTGKIRYLVGKKTAFSRKTIYL